MTDRVESKTRCQDGLCGRKCPLLPKVAHQTGARLSLLHVFLQHGLFCFSEHCARICRMATGFRASAASAPSLQAPSRPHDLLRRTLWTVRMG